MLGTLNEKGKSKLRQNRHILRNIPNVHVDNTCFQKWQ